MAEQTIGAARIEIEVDTTKWDAAIASGKTQLKGMSEAAQKEYDRLNGREKRRVGSLLKQADTLGKTRAEQILYNAALRGVPTHILDELKTKLEANERATLANNKAMHSGSKAFSGSSKTARELQFAMRGLPAQFTDIATSLQGGQRPLTVLLQQGGQLKDMFGGIRPALSAVGSQLVKLVNPYTLAAGAAGLLAVAWQKGQNEVAAYNKALILTGGYAGQTADQLQGMAQELDRISGVTEGKAAAAIATVTRSGRFTGEEIRNVTRAALEMQDATGRACRGHCYRGSRKSRTHRARPGPVRDKEGSRQPRRHAEGRGRTSEAARGHRWRAGAVRGARARHAGTGTPDRR